MFRFPRREEAVKSAAIRVSAAGKWIPRRVKGIIQRKRSAMDQYKRDNRRPFPTWSEVLEVLYSLGYRKVAEPTALPGLSGEGKKVPPKG